jgi:hypothetical protein
MSYGVRFEKMFYESVLGLSLVSQGLRTVETVQNLLYLLRFETKCGENFKKHEMHALLEKNQSYFLRFSS